MKYGELMSMFGDYKSYRKYEPHYSNWKKERDIQNAKRLEYLKQHPELRSKEDIQRGKILLRAIDIMDEHSQKRAEDMEVATQSAIGIGLDLAILGGMGAGFLVSRLKPIQKILSKFANGNKKAKIISTIVPTAIGGVAGTIAAFPLMAWGAKAEVSASRKGRFEAMNEDLKNPSGFAVLTDEQVKEADKISKNIVLKEDEKKNMSAKFTKGIKYLKDLASDSKEYKQQRKMFQYELSEEGKHINDYMTPEEAEKAKKDQQLLTKLVEKIDIASQDYAENTELATGAVTAGILGCSALGSLIMTKLLNALKVKNSSKISAITTISGTILSLVVAIASANIQKQASRVGRYMVKKELVENPDNLIYVNDEKTGEIKDIQIQKEKKKGMIRFLIDAYKNNKEFNEYQKTKAKDEKRFYKATEKLKLTPEQLKDAKRLQKNTFRTFNKIDENSQKYSESVEAIGQAASFPINLIFAGIGAALAVPFLTKKSKGNLEQIENFAKYIGIILLSTLPSIGINFYLTKEQKKASRIADMLAINEMKDYRQFR